MIVGAPSVDGLPALSSPTLATPAGLVRVGFRAMGTDVDVLLPVGRERSGAAVVAVFESWTRR